MHQFDTIILGAGIAGLGTARGLAKRGKRVLVLDRKNLQGAASARAAGMLNPYLGMQPDNPLLPLTLRAFQAFPHWVRELERVSGSKIGYAKTGLLYVARSKAETQDLKKRHIWQKKLPLKTQLLESKILRKKFPELNEKIQSGLFLPQVGRVKPHLFMQALHRYVKKSKIDVRLTSKALRIKFNDEQHCEVHSGKTVYHARSVVDACGAWANPDKWVKKAQSIRPARGQIFVVKTPKIKTNTILHTVDDGYCVPWGNSKFLCGSTLEYVGYRPQTTRSGKKQVMGQLHSMLGDLSQMRMLDSWAGLRPASCDGLPYVGHFRQQPNFFVATGYFRSGILLGAFLGDLLAESIVKGRPSLDLKALSPDRTTKVGDL